MVSPGPKWIGRENLEREISEFRYSSGIILLVMGVIVIISSAITIILYLNNHPWKNKFLLISFLILCCLFALWFLFGAIEKNLKKRRNDLEKIYNKIENGP